MTPRKLYDCFGAVLGLPLSGQAACVRFAAEASVPIWRDRCVRLGVEDRSGELLDIFGRWLSGAAMDGELDRVAKRFHETLPQDLRDEDHPAGGYAGWSLLDIVMIALDQCGDVHDDILHTAVCYAAAANCRVGIEAVWVRMERLTPAELEFLDQWWRRCCEQFPGLVNATSPSAGL